MDAPTTPSDDQVDFTLRFLDGRGLLGLRQPVRVAAASLDRLELEVPNLRFPFDLSGGAQRFQNRRCRFREAQLTLTEAGLSEWLAGRNLAGFGVEQVSLRVSDGLIHVAFEARIGDRSVPATVRARVEPASGTERRVRVVLGEVRLYGWQPVPGPLVGMALLLGAGGRARSNSDAAADSGADGTGAGGLSLRGVGEVEFDPLDAVLWRTLVPLGWRLPSRRGAVLTAVVLGGGRIELVFAEPTVGALIADERHDEPAQCAEGEARLLHNDLEGALAAYRQAWQHSRHPQLFERIVGLLAASPSRWDEAVAFIGNEADRPSNLIAQLALANIEAESGETGRAARRFAELAVLARLAGEAEDEAAALLRAAELFLATEPSRATALFERLLQKQPGHVRAAEMLAGCYAWEHRYADLARLEGERIALAPGPEAQARAHARLGLVLLDHLGQSARARDELERAVRLSTHDAAAWHLLARAYEANGERDRAIGALDCVVALSSDPSLRCEAHVRAARILLADGEHNLEPALARFQAALAIDPRHVEAVTGEAELYARSGRFEDASAAFERALAAIEPGPAGNGPRRRMLLDEAERCLGRGAADLARQLLERATQYGHDREVLERVVALAETDGRHADAEQALRLLVSLGDDGAALRRARALLRLGRAAEARQAIADAAARHSADPALPFDDALAAELEMQAARALGDSGGLRAALERLLQLREDPALRVEAATLALAAGEPAVAERHLASCGDNRAALELQSDLLEARGEDDALDATLARLVRVLGDDPQARARSLLRQAALRARGNRLNEALECYRAAASLFPERSSEEATAARAGQGRTAYLLGRWDEARTAWEPLHQQGLPPRAQRAVRLGEIAHRQRDLEAAARFYRAALDLGVSGPDVIRTYEALVAIADARGDVRTAIDTLVESANNPRAGESPTARADRLVAAARRQAEAGDREAAARLHESALAIDPDHREALDGLEALAALTGDQQRTAEALARRAEAMRGRPRERKGLLIRLAEIQEDQLGRADAALETHRQILEIDGDHWPSLRFLSIEAREAGETVEEQRHLERLAHLPGGTPSQQADVHARLAELYFSAGREEDSEREARVALGLSPRHPGALALLDEFLSREELLDQLEPLLALRAELEPEFERALDLEYRRAAILEQLGRRDDALASYARIVEVRPSAAAAWERMAALHRQAGEWSALLDVLGRLAAGRAASGEPAEAAAVAVEMSHLAHDRLGDPALSRRFLERALSYDDHCALALDGLLALARVDGDTEAQDQLLGRRVAAEGDPQRREALLVERARGRRDRGDVAGAYEMVTETPIEQASDALLRLRAQLAEGLRAEGAAVAPLEELARRARRAGDAAAERDLVRRLARLAARDGRRGPEAAQLFARALALDADDTESAAALVEAERDGHSPGERLPALEALLGALRRGRQSPDREAEVALEIAALRRAQGDLPAAAARLREAMALLPDRVELVALLGEVLLELGQVDPAVRMLEQAADSDKDGAVWAVLGMAYEASGDLPRAAVAFNRAGDAADPARRAEALERAGREDEALATWRKLGGEVGRSRAAALLLRWARKAQAADRVDEAAQLAIQALNEGPCPPEALVVAAGRLDHQGLLALVEKLTAQRSAPEAAALWRSAAQVLPPASARAALERSLAVHADAEAMAMLARLLDPEEGAALAREALKLDPACAAGALALAALSQADDVMPALRTAWKRAVARDKPTVSVAIAQQLRDTVGDGVAAREVFRRALEEGASGDTAAVALRALAQIEAMAGDKSGAREWLRASRARGVASADDLRLLAELCSELGDHDEAFLLLSEVGAPAPLVVRTLQAGGRWRELVELLEESVDGAAATEARAALMQAALICDEHLHDPARAAALLERAVPLGPSDADLWSQLGRLLAGPLADPERAANAFARAHAADPTRVEVLLPLAEYHLAHAELDPAEDYLRRALQHAGAGRQGGELRAERARIHLGLADVAAGRGNPTIEEKELRDAAAEGSARAWSRLAARYRELGYDDQRAEALLAWAECEPARQVELYREARPLLDPHEAARIDDLVARLDPSDEEARARVLGRLRANGDDVALGRRLVEAIEHVPPSARLPLRLELGEVYERLGDDDGAFAAWTGALGEAPSLEIARRLLAVARRIGRSTEAGQFLEGVFAHRLDAAAALIAEAYLAPSGDNERARPWVERAILTGADDGSQGATLKALLRSAGRWHDLIAHLDGEAARRSGRARLPFELEAAEVVEERLGDLVDAAVRYSRAWELAPEQQDVMEHARDLLLTIGDRAAALAALDKQITGAEPGDEAPLRTLRAELSRVAGVDIQRFDDLAAAARIEPATWVTQPVSAASTQPPSRRLIPPAPVSTVSAASLFGSDTEVTLELEQAGFPADPAVQAPPLNLPSTLAALARGASLAPAPSRPSSPASDPASLYATYRTELERLPLDAVDRITELRQLLGELARQLGDREAARSYFELVLAQHPERVDVIRPLVDLYARAGEWERCAELLGRMSYLARTPAERADWTYRQAEVRRHYLGDEEAATAGYLRAADYNPEHAPTMRRLIAIYFADGEIGSLLEVLAELERQGEPIGESQLQAALALSVAGEEARARALLDNPGPPALAEVVASVRLDDVSYIDQVLGAASRALAAGGLRSSELAEALRALVAENPARIGARVAAARLHEQSGDLASARLDLAVLAWVDPDGNAARHLDELPPAPAAMADVVEPVHPAAVGPLRDALRLLGPLTVGVGAPLPGAQPSPSWAARMAPLATGFGFPIIDAAVVDAQVEPVWAEPTTPPRLLIRRDIVSDEPAVMFAAVRALHLLAAGVPLVDERAEEDLAALLTAAAAIFDPHVVIESTLQSAWLAALRTLPLRPEYLRPEVRAALQQALQRCNQPGVAAMGPAFANAERLTADRIAFMLTGDLGAGLRALAPELTLAYEGRSQRASMLAAPGPLRELIAFAGSPEGLRRLGKRG